MICSTREQMQKNILNQEKILHVLKELEKNPQTTQRYLSQKIGISLGKVNFLLNALIAKGIIEAKNFKNAKNKLSYRYLLTPEGIKAKIELTQKFLTWKLEEYERLKKEIEDFREGLAGLKAIGQITD